MKLTFNDIKITKFKKDKMFKTYATYRIAYAINTNGR